MDRTRLSLYYLATYLPLAGLALVLVPDFVAIGVVLTGSGYYPDWRGGARPKV